MDRDVSEEHMFPSALSKSPRKVFEDKRREFCSVTD